MTPQALVAGIATEHDLPLLVISARHPEPVRAGPGRPVDLPAHRFHVGHEASHTRELGLHGNPQIPVGRIEAKNRVGHRLLLTFDVLASGSVPARGIGCARGSFGPAPSAGICDSEVVQLSHQGDLTMATRQPAGPAVEPGGTALGITAAAGLILMLVGVFGMIQGIVGLLDNDLYVVTNKWLFELDPTAWGWGHILIGLVALCAGVGLFFGRVWAQNHRDHRRGVQHPGQLRLAALLPDLGPARHRVRPVRDLGRHRAWQ